MFAARSSTPPALHAAQVREMLELVLFTDPGERLNRPDFGAGLLALPFEPSSVELAAAVEVAAQSALQRWLSDVLEVGSVRVTVDDATLRVELAYRLLSATQFRTETFTRRQGA